MQFNVTRDHPGLQLFDVTECQPVCAWLRQLTKVKSIAVYSVVQIDWLSVCVSVQMCMEAQRKTLRRLASAVTLSGVLLWYSAETDSHWGKEWQEEAWGEESIERWDWREGKMRKGKVNTNWGRKEKGPCKDNNRPRAIQGKRDKIAKEGGKKEAEGKKRLRETRRKKKRTVGVAGLAFLHPSSASRLWSVSQPGALTFSKGKHDSRTELKHSQSELLPVLLNLPSKYCKCKDFCSWAWFWTTGGPFSV